MIKIDAMLRLFPIQRFIVSGKSMFPTIRPNQNVLCFNWAYLFKKPKVGDIVVIKYHGKEMVKRIHLYHDRSIFVLGDNEKMSTDSRDFGWIDRKEIVGKIISNF